MFAKIVLCVTNHRLLAGLWRFGRLVSHQAFENNPQGLDGFSRYLHRHQGIRLYLLVDAIEEDYRLETLPHTMGRARHEIVTRKLNQLYRSTPYRTAHFIGREDGKRRDDRFVFAALNSADFLQGWVDQIQAQQAPLAGIYLLPTVSQHLVRRMKPLPPHLLLCERLSTGLRQTYLHQGHLRISRLAPYSEEAQTAPGYFYAAEIEKTRLYLVSQRYLGRDVALEMAIPAHQDDAKLRAELEQGQGTRCAVVDMLQLARGLKGHATLLQTYPELLHMHLLANGTVPDSLAAEGLVKHYRLNVLRQGIRLATAAVLLAALATSAVYFKMGFDRAAATQQAALETRQQEQQYQAVARDFPQTPVAASELRTVAELEKTLFANAVLPDRTLRLVSRAISASPEIGVNRLNWLLSNESEPKDSAGAQGAASVAAGTTAFSADPALLYPVVFLDGEVRPFNGDYRAALESVHRLAERLRADDGVAQVVIMQAPVNVSSYSSLQGSTADERTTQTQPALFKLRIIFRHEEVAA